MSKRNPDRKLLYCYLILIFASLCFSASCQNLESDKSWGLPILEEGNISLMTALHQEWSKTDGEITFIIARQLFWALLLNPNAFYKELSVDTVNYKRFIDDIDVLVFWNPNDTTTAQYERLRIVAIERLVDQTYSIDGNHRQLHEEMIQTLQKVKVSHVD